MLQNDNHLNCLCVMARLIEALAIYNLCSMYLNSGNKVILSYLILLSQNGVCKMHDDLSYSVHQLTSYSLSQIMWHVKIAYWIT